MENEINDIIKIILCLPFSLNNNNNTLEEYLKEIFNKNHWKINNLEKIFDGFNEDEIINNLITYLNKKNANNLLTIELVIFEKIFNIIKNGDKK